MNKAFEKAFEKAPDQVHLLMEDGMVRGVFLKWDDIKEVRRKHDKTGRRFTINTRTVFKSSEEFEEVLDVKLRTQVLGRLTNEEKRVLGLLEGES